MLPTPTYTASVGPLQCALGHLLDLQLQVKSAHWNVRGAWFISLHQWFDQLAAHVSEHADDVAERIVALGGVAGGSPDAILSYSTLDPLPDEGARGPSVLSDLEERYRHVIEKVHVAMGSIAVDVVSVDLLTDVLRGLEKDHGFLRSHLQIG